MPLTPTETSLCNKMVSDYQGLVSPVKMGRDGIIAKRSGLMGMLGGMKYTPPTVLADKLGMFRNAVGMSIPDPSELDTLKNMLERCNYLNTFGPTAALAGLTQSALSNISSLINNFSTGTPEFGAGKIASMINQALSSLMPGGSGLSDLLKSANQLLECLSTVCASQDPSYIGGVDNIDNDLSSLTTSMGLVDDPYSPKFGEMDYEKIYDSLGMSTPQRYAITSAMETIDEQKIRAKTSIASCITAVKGQIGGMF